MPCMCGDVMCPSCGPAQGYNPEFEALCEWIQEDVLADFPPGIDVTWLAEELGNRLDMQPHYLLTALKRRQEEWTRELLSPQQKSLLDLCP